MPTWVLWTTCFALILARALVAAADASLFGVSDLRAKELSLAHPGAGSRVLRHKTHREASATALRLGMVLSGFLAAAIGAFVPPQVLDLTRLGEAPWLAVVSALLGAFLVGILATLIEVGFRGLAAENPEGWALRLSWLVSLLVLLFYPPMRLLLGALNLVARPLGRRLRFEPPPPPLEELEKLLAAQAANDPDVDKSAPQLIRSIFELSDKRCRDVMVARTDVVTVEINSPNTEILRVLAEENHSRIPVYRDDVDHIVGVLHARDLIPLLQHPELIVLSDVIRPANFVPWMKPIGDLLREMQKKKIHMAMVVDEFGGFMGIVTLEDILREIVGDIGDEFEVEEKYVEKLPDGSFLVDAAMEKDEFTRTFGFPLPDGDFDTLGGFISSFTGSIPDVGERFSFNAWHFTVHSKEGARIDRVRVARAKPAAKDGGPGSSAAGPRGEAPPPPAAKA